MLPSSPVIIGLDDGYDYTKAVTRSASARIPSSYSLQAEVKHQVLGEKAPTENVYEIEGVKYAVGPDVAGMTTRFEDFPYHPANLAIALDAIRQVVPPGTPVHAVAGVPLNRYYNEEGDNSELILAKKTAAWRRPVKGLTGLALPQIVQVTVISEAVAAWLDFVVNDRLEEQEHLINDFMAVVDIGGRTTDIAVFEDGRLNMSMSDTLDNGVLDVQNAVVKALRKKYPALKIKRSMLNEIVKFGGVRLNTENLDLSQTVISERTTLAQKIEIFMQQQFGAQLPLIKRILFVGGGAQALTHEIKERFPRAVFANDPQMANARGMLKYGVISSQEEHPAVVNG